MDKSRYMLGCCASSGAAKPSECMRRAEFETKIGNIGFDMVDDNKSGKISRAQWNKAFDKVDTDGDGKITRGEWEISFGRGGLKLWDCDGDGTIDRAEWQH